MATLLQQHPPCPEAVERCVHHVIAEQVSQQPDALAICAWDGDFSYARLDELSTGLAHHLANLGIGPESIVPICFEKSAWAVVAMLGVIKAAGAFVPLDPSHPMSRMQLVMREVKAQVILASPQTSSKFIDAQETVVIVSKSAIEQLPKSTSPLRVKTNVTPTNAMYVLFTSGSTGTPKGVVIEHVAACSSITYHGPLLGFDRHSRVFQFASYTFDASIAEIFTTLSFGGCICVPSDAERMSNTAGAINRMMANWLFVTPSVLRLLDPNTLPSLRTLAVGGEAVSQDNIDQWAGKSRMMAVYGPTECCIFSSAAIRYPNSRPAHIGWAVGCLTWVVDPENHNQLTPSGAIGELLIQGPILARGYLNDLVKTEKAFITDPHWLPRGPLSHCRRFYKTGDMVRCNPDGSMDFVGRRDSQVKVNGQRIELGEIEYQIQCDERVSLVSVVFPTVGYCRQRLVAILTLRKSAVATERFEDFKEFSGSYTNSTASELSLIKESLSKSLPVYMQPTAWWLLPNLPLSTSGKIDRKLLQSRVEEMNESTYVQISHVDNEETSSAPSTQNEAVLQKLCSRVLLRPSHILGLSLSFIALGGDSLRAMELVNIARTEGMTLEFQDIMRAESLALLAPMINISTDILRSNDDPRRMPLEFSVAQRCLIENLGRQAEDIEALYPCTAMQQGMMISQMKRPSEYHVTLSYELVNTDDNGVVDSARLQEAWAKVVDRHPALRSIFMVCDSDEASFTQVVLKSVSPEVIVQDYCSRDDLDPLAAATTPEYLTDKPHHRLKIFRISKNRIICNLNISHLICDGDSLSILLRDLRRAYEGNLASEQGPRYSDYVHYLQNRPLGSAVTYWTAHLAGVEPCHFPAGEDMSTNLRTIRVEFKLNAGLSALCRQYNVTTSNVLQVIWALVLRRYIGTSHACFGYIVSGRGAPIKDMQDAVGAYINMLVCRVNCSGSITLIDAVKQVKEDFLEGQRHQHCSLADLQQSLQLGGRALFNTAVSIQTWREVNSGDSAVSWRKIHDRSPTEFAMTLNVISSKSEMDIALTFWEPSISEDVAAQVANTFSSMLCSFTEDPNLLVKSLDLLPSNEKKKLAQWNRELPVTVEACTQNVFREWAFKTPDALAIFSWEGKLTYSRLDALSTRLANRLVELGVGPVSFVPLCFEKSTWAVVAMLAVLKAGGAFVPLDPSHPMTRSLSLIQQVGARILLVSSNIAEKFANLSEFCIVASEAAIEALPPATSKVVSSVAPRDPMYIIFTSGSTGKPKGVVVDHLAACSSISAQGKQLGFDQDSRVFQFASYTFDASITEIWTTLFHGGCVCIPSDVQRLNDMAGAMVEMRVNWALLTPSVARLINPTEVPSLRTLCIGGESIGQDLIDVWAGKVQLKAAYGPTECSVICSTGSLVPGKSQPKSIGRASGCLLWIVNTDDSNQLMAIGAVGELLVQGPIVAQGYLNAPENTASKFVPAPSWLEDFHPGMADRFYKTGDLVYYQVDGSINFVGRIDAQRKFNGQRLEMGEIEYQIKAQLPNLRQTVVEILKPIHGVHQETLVAFVCFSDASNRSQTYSNGQILRLSTDQKTTLLRLQEMLRAKLPAYMVPSLFIPLQEMPTTTSGKVDRRSLAQYLSEISEDQFLHYSLSDAVKRPPSTNLERRLQRLWAKVLQIREDLIGSDDSFLQLGGHSYAAIQLSGEARRNGIALPMDTVLRNPTLSQMALSSRLQTASQGFGLEVLPFSLIKYATGRDALLGDIENRYDITRGIVQDVYPCTPLQAGLMALTSKRSGAYIIQRVFKMSENADVARFREAWDVVVRESDILRTRIIDVENVGLCQIVLRTPIDFLLSSNVTEYLDADKRQSMVLGQPLTRFAIVEEMDGSGRGCRLFVWTIHHALYDGWSMPKLLDRVSRVYNHIETPQAPRFSSFIKYLDGIDAKESARFWMSKFEQFSSPPFPMKPSVHYQPHVDFSVLADVSIKKVNGSKTTTSNIIRAAWALLISRYSETPNVAFGAVHSGRNAPLEGIEHIIGPTITTVPVRVHIDRDQSVQKYLTQIQEDALDMIPFEQAGLQNISRLNSECKLACEFQNLLVVQEETSTEYGERHLDLEDISSPLQGFVGCALVAECKIETEKVSVRIYHDSKVISRQQVRWILNQFCHAVRQLSSIQGGVTVGEVELVSPQDVSTVIAWNEAYPETARRCIHQVIEEQVRLRADAPAISAWDGDISYAQLDHLATRLSYRLVQLGVQPGACIPLCFEKSAWMIVAMLAVLKAGGAFVPLDPSQPPRRLQEICREVEAKLMLSSNRYSRICDSFGIESLVIYAGLIEHLPIPKCDVQPLVTPQDPAYIIFTSGTTGKPKGVLIEHEAFCSGAAKHGDAMLLKRTSRVLQFASYSFDASLVEILTPLMHGACVCAPGEDSRVNDLAGAINDMKITWAVLTPSVSRLLSPAAVPGLQTLVLAGEPMSMHDVATWSQLLNLVNAYGPSECSVLASAHLVSASDDSACNIGRAVGCLSWVVDPDNHNRLAPVGCIGELLIEGPTLARSYINKAKESADAFICNPLWVRSLSDDASRNRRMYKTGDLVRYRPDGGIEFVGRKDTQIKLRGQRIELGEIEYQAKQYLTRNTHSVMEVVVDVFTAAEGKGRQVLAVFFSTYERCAMSLDDGGLVLKVSDSMRRDMGRLRTYLSQSLPTYMIPSVYLPVTSLPKSFSGKADRKRLCLLGAKLSAMDLAIYSLEHTEKITPKTEMEMKLQGLWACILKLEPSDIGVHDSFLGLGGDSIDAMRLASETRKAGIGLDVGLIFEHPVLLDMALSAQDLAHDMLPETSLEPFALVGGRQSNATEEAARQCGVAVDIIEDMYPCTPLQAGLMALSVKKPGTYVYRDVFRLPPELDLERFCGAWETVVRATAILRTLIIYSEVYESCQVVLELDIKWRKGADLDAYMQEDEEAPMEYGTSLSRFGLVEDAAGGAFFVWTLHHALYDGWSLPRILGNVQGVYNGASVKIAPPFATFVNHLGTVLGSKSDEFWRSELLNASPVTFPQLSANQYQPCASQTLADTLLLPHERPRGITMPTIVRAAWALLVAKYTDTDDLVFGAIQAGRHYSLPGITEMIGPTITTFPVRMKLDFTMTIDEYLCNVQCQAVKMLPFEHAGLQNIRRLDKGCAAACDFQSLLDVQPLGVECNTDFLGLERVRTPGKGFMTYLLVVQCFYGDGKIDVNFSYDSGALQEQGVLQMMAQFRHVIGQLLDPRRQRLVCDIDLLSPEDKSSIWEWNKEYPGALEACMHDVIWERARVKPDLPAVYSWDGSLTYRELDQQATSLANSLVSIGVGMETMVPLCFEKSVWAVVSMLAVMKAGGAFVSLDPSHPTLHLETVIRDIGAKVIIASTLHVKKFVGLADTVVEVGTMNTLPTKQTTTQVSSRVSPKNAAYAVFTSGSTGKPKGIIIEHQAFCSSARAHGATMRLGEGSRVLQFAAYTFDASIGDIFTTLMHGGCVCVPSEDERMSDLAGVINRLNINTACLTPTVASLLSPKDVPTLRVLSLGGEALKQDNLNVWADQVHLINIYGPAECTIWCAGFSGMTAASQAANIGRGIGALLWVVEASSHDRLCPIGCVGELLIEGPVLARGYLNEKEKTATAFIVNPTWLSTEQNNGGDRRLYKTGDLVRLNPDGSYTFVGRRDNQVKLHGQRIELGEIEHHVTSHPFVRHSIVNMPLRGPYEQSLVAVASLRQYEATDARTDDLRLVGSEHRATSSNQVAEICDALSQVLPRHMVPKTWIVVEDIALLASGKMNHKLVRTWLEEMSQDMYREIAQRQASLHDTDAALLLEEHEDTARLIAEKVIELLRGKGNDVHDLQGRDLVLSQVGLDSIQLVSLATFIRKRFGIDVLKRIFAHHRTTVRSISRLIMKNVESTSPIDITEGMDLLAEYRTLNAEISRLEVRNEGKRGYLRGVTKTILITGVTGFLGSEILKQVLERHETTKAIVLVRAIDLTQAKGKVVNAAKIGLWWDDRFGDRLEIWLGDLAQPRLGLGESEWNILTGKASSAGRTVDAVIHNGAAVHWGANYMTLKATNVGSTMAILKALSQSMQSPRFTFISGGHMSLEREDEKTMALMLASANGYSQTKFISELLIKEYARREAQLRPDGYSSLSIVKPGLIIGAADRGVSNIDDYIWRVVSSAIKINAFNAEDTDSWLMIAGADQVASLIISKCTHDTPQAETMLSLHDGMTIGDFWTILNRDFGFALRPLKASEWLDELARDVENTGALHPLWPVLHFLQGNGGALGAQRRPGRTYETCLGVKNLRMSVKRSMEYLLELGYLGLDKKGIGRDAAFSRSTIIKTGMTDFCT